MNENLKLKIIFFGTPQEVIPVLENLTKYYDVVAVVTAPDQKSGRKQLLTPSPVKVFTEQHNIPVLQPTQLSTLNAQLFVVASYGKIIPHDILELPKFGAINIHPSLLPKYRGPTPIQTALLNGEQTSGITFIKMDAQIDHGPILYQIPFTLEKTDTFGWLMQSTFSQAANVLPHVIDEYIAGKLKPQPQDETKATYTKRITKEDGYIDINKLETGNWKLEIDRKIRAYYPWPTVWTKVRSKKQEARIKFLPNQRLQLEGKNPVGLKDFLNGYPEMEAFITKLFPAIKKA